mgnify:CR=1 FL=1|jgi:hypothetical protein|tara:strand:+ start:661 stop:954 length:294 start_codon:yes stop_codon:yes gene_type:complete
MSDKFLCSGCGACCVTAGKMGVMPDRGDGGCINLNKKNECLIYEDRPDICRVDVMHKITNPELSKKEYFIKSTKACHEIIDLLKINIKYKIPLKDYE